MTLGSLRGSQVQIDNLRISLISHLSSEQRSRGFLLWTSGVVSILKPDGPTR